MGSIASSTGQLTNALSVMQPAGDYPKGWHPATPSHASKPRFTRDARVKSSNSICGSLEKILSFCGVACSAFTVEHRHRRRSSRLPRLQTSLICDDSADAEMAHALSKSASWGPEPCEAVYSPTALSSYMVSPFAAWMDRLLKDRPNDPRCAMMCEDLREMFQARGQAVEDMLLDCIKGKHPGLRVVDLTYATDGVRSNDHRTAAMEKTMQAITQHDTAVLYQAPLYHRGAGLYGIADFVWVRRKEDGEIECNIWDTKLATHPQHYFLAQLACYAEAISECSKKVTVAKIGLVLGEEAAANGTVQELDANLVRPHFLPLWAKLRAFQDQFDPAGQPPDPVETPKQSWNRWAKYADAILTERDDLLLIAGMTRVGRAKLIAAGCKTIHSLAALPTSVTATVAAAAKMEHDSLKRLCLQARLQVQSLNRPTSRPASRLLAGARETLASLPDIDRGDVFLDMEGMALKPGVEYLIAMSDRKGSYYDWWAHTKEEEQESFRSVLEFLQQRREQFPKLHVYHYAHYEASAFRRFAEFSTSAKDRRMVQELLSVLVDLYPIIKGSLALGTRGYGLKHVELMYRDARQTDVAKATHSLEVYQSWLDEPDGLDWESSEKLRQLRDYNRDDCESTRQLLSWLRRRCSRVFREVPGSSEDCTATSDKAARSAAKAKAAPKSVAAEMQFALEQLKKAAEARSGDSCALTAGADESLTASP